jgi:hypothetical protein
MVIVIYGISRPGGKQVRATIKKYIDFRQGRNRAGEEGNNDGDDEDDGKRKGKIRKNKKEKKT